MSRNVSVGSRRRFLVGAVGAVGGGGLGVLGLPGAAVAAAAAATGTVYIASDSTAQTYNSRYYP